MSDRRRGAALPPAPNPLTLPLEIQPPFNRRESDAEEAILKRWTTLGEKVLAQDGPQPEIVGTEIKEPEGSMSPVKQPVGARTQSPPPRLPCYQSSILLKPM